MRSIREEVLQDCSTPEQFQFAVQCEQCGVQWHSIPIRFSRAGINPDSAGKEVIYETLYRLEKERALKQAAAEAVGVFNQCPICRRLVCDHCFWVGEDLDLCQSCAERLQINGEPVLQICRPTEEKAGG